MKNGAYHIKQLLDYFHDQEEAYRMLLNYTEEQQKQYNLLFDKFETSNSDVNTSTNVKGKALEDLVEFIFKTSPFFNVEKNLRTSTNELDLLVDLTPMGRVFSSEGHLNIPTPFIGECKNYNKAIGVTWVGKLYSLVCTSNKNLGILFSYHGFTGKNWSDSTGLARKICLASKQEHLILSFDYLDFKLLRDGEVFINILNKKIFQIQNDTSIHYNQHELDGKFI